MSMSVTEAVLARRSVRAYRDIPVASEEVEAILRLAAQAPSGGNMQPWIARLLVGEPLRELKAVMRRRCVEAPEGEVAQGLLPADLPPEQSGRRGRRIRDIADVIAGTSHDPVAEQAFFLDHFQFFGAPMGAFVLMDRRLDAPQWLDLGLYIQTVMLLLCEAGLDSCYIGAWAMFEPTVMRLLGLPDRFGLVCGLSIGYGDPAAPINRLAMERDDPLKPVEG